MVLEMGTWRKHGGEQGEAGQTPGAQNRSPSENESSLAFGTVSTSPASP